MTTIYLLNQPKKIRLEKTNACTHTNILGWREMFKRGKYEDNKERKMLLISACKRQKNEITPTRKQLNQHRKI